MFKIHSLPAGEGDALWVEWGSVDAPHRMLIDMGRARHGRSIYKKISELPEEQRKFELFIISHVDRDHIGGVLAFLKKPWIAGLEFADIWFNDWNHLHGKKHTDEDVPSYKRAAGRRRTRGAVQGEGLKAWLSLKGHVWNKAFDDGPVVRPTDKLAAPIKLKGGMKVTVLGPTQPILSSFQKTWAKEVLKAIAGKNSNLPAHLRSFAFTNALMRGGRAKPTKPKLNSMADVERLASKKTKTDHSGANGSSISVLLEYKGKKALLSGDAHPEDVIAALNLINKDGPVALDFFKLPHHGSEKNVTAEMIRKVTCPRFLISTSGSYFYHPDATAVARIITESEAPEILFNVPSAYNKWWRDSTWQQKFGYSSRVGSEVDGISVDLIDS